MACVIGLKRKSGTYYYLQETIGGKSVKTAYLGKRYPLPRGMPRDKLPNHWIERLRRKAKQRTIKPAPNPIFSDGKFAVVYADPPWRYEFSETEPRSIEAHYDTLSLEEICNYRDGNGTPVQEKFADNAVLFLWATQPKIREALQVIDAWGFDYRTGAIWVKDKLGMGYWWRQKHELLLLAKKGNFPAPDTGKRPPSIIQSPWSGHSKKPKRIYRMIETMCPLPNSYKEAGRDYYLELFKRGHKRPFWTGWGQEYGEV